MKKLDVYLKIVEIECIDDSYYYETEINLYLSVRNEQTILQSIIFCDGNHKYRHRNIDAIVKRF